MSRPPSRGFTLIELLVVVALLALFLLIPVMGRRSTQRVAANEHSQRDSLLQAAAKAGRPVSGVLGVGAARHAATAWPDGRLAVRLAGQP